MVSLGLTRQILRLTSWAISRTIKSASCMPRSQRYAVWQSKLNSKHPCWFCETMAQKIEITKAGDEAHWLKGHWPLCVANDYGRGHCRCTVNQVAEVGSDQLSTYDDPAYILDNI